MSSTQSHGVCTTLKPSGRHSRVRHISCLKAGTGGISPKGFSQTKLQTLQPAGGAFLVSELCFFSCSVADSRVQNLPDAISCGPGLSQGTLPPPPRQSGQDRGQDFGRHQGQSPAGQGSEGSGRSCRRLGRGGCARARPRWGETPGKGGRRRERPQRSPPNRNWSKGTGTGRNWKRGKFEKVSSPLPRAPFPSGEPGGAGSCSPSSWSTTTARDPRGSPGARERHGGHTEPPTGHGHPGVPRQWQRGPGRAGPSCPSGWEWAWLRQRDPRSTHGPGRDWL